MLSGCVSLFVEFFGFRRSADQHLLSHRTFHLRLQLLTLAYDDMDSTYVTLTPQRLNPNSSPYRNTENTPCNSNAFPPSFI